MGRLRLSIKGSRVVGRRALHVANLANLVRWRESSLRRSEVPDQDWGFTKRPNIGDTLGGNGVQLSPGGCATQVVSSNQR